MSEKSLGQASCIEYEVICLDSEAIGTLNRATI